MGQFLFIVPRTFIESVSFGFPASGPTSEDDPHGVVRVRHLWDGILFVFPRPGLSRVAAVFHCRPTSLIQLAIPSAPSRVPFPRRRPLLVSLA